ncbi:PED1A-like protein, partial [Mya arenaria]
MVLGIERSASTRRISTLSDLSKDPLPDVILMNSCLWDISRYGNRSVDHYKDNLATLFRRMKEALPETCLVIWNMTLPISKQARGGFLIPQVEYMNSSLRLDILEANFFVHKLALSYGFNTLDLHYYLRHQLQRRAGDGVHWDMTAHRRMTNLILSHVAQAWGRKPPENASRVLTMQRAGNANKRPIRAGEDFTFNCNANMNNNNNNRSKYSINNNLLPPSCNQNVQGPITNQININIANNYVKNNARHDRDQIKSQHKYLLEKPIPQLDPLQFRNLNNQPVAQTHAPARTNYNAYGRNNNAAAVPGMVHNDHFLPPGQFSKND